MKPTWDWLLTVMDATEAQLRFGVSLTRSADPTHPEHPLNNASSLSGGNFSGLLNTAALSLTLQSNTGRNQRSGIATSSNISTPQASTRLTVGFAGVGEPSRNSREREGIHFPFSLPEKVTQTYMLHLYICVTLVSLYLCYFRVELEN